ncbi:ankyrin repeat domain-containing protein [Patescibacteria group bacterium]|nr:ankyrin repeat domain-containing protein [Patescibacteria group bacterium]
MRIIVVLVIMFFLSGCGLPRVDTNENSPKVAQASAPVLVISQDNKYRVHQWLFAIADDKDKALVAANQFDVLVAKTEKFIMFDIDTIDPRNSCTALHRAVLRKNHAVAAILVNKGASLEVKCLGGHTPFFLALNSRDKIFAKKMIEFGANPNIMNDIGYSPLHYAVGSDDKEIAALLLGLPTIDVNFSSSKASGSQTAMHIAVMQKNDVMIGLLRERGARIDIPNGNGRLAKDLAMINYTASSGKIFRILDKKIQVKPPVIAPLKKVN